MDPQEITIVQASEKNIPEIASLAGEIWRTHYPGIISHEQIEYMLAKMYSLEKLRMEIGEQGICYYQIFVGDKMAGYASLGPSATPGIFKLHKIYTLPGIHGQGIGWRLLEHVEKEAMRRGAKRLILATNKQNVKAIAFYQRNGFEIVESVVTDFGGGYVMDDFIFAKKLV